MSDVPDLSSDEEHYNEEEWQEMDASNSSVTCLFCTAILPTIDEAVAHCEKDHNFNLITLKSKFNMDCYSYIKLINYIKTNGSKAEDIMCLTTSAWNDDKYLKPIDNDEWLMFDFDSLMEIASSPKSYHANVENGLVTLSQAHFLELQRTIQTLTEQLKESQTHLQMAKEDMTKMQMSMKTIVEGNGSTADNESVIIVDCVSKVPLECDEGYFSSYAHFGIHYDMLSDKVRTESYKNAILQNKQTFNDKIVLDLGCGTGILSMFCATAGSKKIYALDQSEVIYHAMDIIRENNLTDQIKTIKGRLENTKLDEKVDIIVSEWMGYFLLFEGMLDSVIYARENYLNPGGLLLPNRCNISLVANGDIDTHKKLINFWSDVYGYKMNCMKSEVVREASVEVVASKNVISKPCVVKDIDLNMCNTNIVEFSSPFELEITQNGFITSLIGYFDTFFDLPTPVSFSTGPQATPTHWKQTLFYFKDCKEVNKGDVITGTITCSRLKTDVRGLSVHINVFGKSHKYILS